MTSRSPSLVQLLNRTAAIVALSSAAFGVSAQTAGTDPAAAGKDKERAAVESAFKRADANSDGKLSKEEAARLPAISAKFAQLDTDKDGTLSAAEFAVGAKAAP